MLNKVPGSNNYPKDFMVFLICTSIALRGIELSVMSQRLSRYPCTKSKIRNQRQLEGDDSICTISYPRHQSRSCMFGVQSSASCLRPRWPYRSMLVSISSFLVPWYWLINEPGYFSIADALTWISLAISHFGIGNEWHVLVKSLYLLCKGEFASYLAFILCFVQN